MADNLQQNDNNNTKLSQDIDTRIKQFCIQHDYVSIINALKGVQKAKQPEQSKKYRYQCIKQIAHQLEHHHGQNKGSLQLDIEGIVELYEYMLSQSTQQEQYHQQLHSILNFAIEQDYKYTFLMYNSKIAQKGEYSIKRLKYLESLYLFIPKIIKSAKGLYDDFIEMIIQIKHIYQQNIANIQQTLIDEHKQEKENNNQNYSQINSLYTKFCHQILNQCTNVLSKIKQESQEKRIYKIIQNSISSLLIITQYSQKLQASLLKVLQLHSKISMFNRLSDIPSIIFICLFQNQTYSSQFSYKLLFYISYLILIKYSPSSTLGQQVGGQGDKMNSFVEQIVKFICKILLKLDSFRELKVQGEKIWINETEFIDLIQIYRRISIFSGFLGAQSKQCYNLIKQVLNFSSNRFQDCPKTRIIIWSELLSLAHQKQIQYRIFCINQYRKILIQYKSSIHNKTFENHPYHNHSGILINNAFEKVSIQLDIALNFSQSATDCNYIGHVISFISNILMCTSIYCVNYNIFHAKLLKQFAQQLQIKCKKLQQKLVLLIDMTKEENKSTDLELVLFRCRQLKFL